MEPRRSRSAGSPPTSTGEPDRASIRLPGPLVAARFVARPNRFVVEAAVRGQGVVRAHLADPGRLADLLVPGVELRLWRHDGSRPRRTAWSVVLGRAPGGEAWVSLDTTVPERLVEVALAAGALPEVGGAVLERREATVGASRFDFRLRGRRGEAVYLEVKSVSLVAEQVALFPDAVTSRGTRHLEELAALAAEPSTRAAVLFVVQREDADRVRAARTIDPDFAAALEAARRAGVKVCARRCRVDLSRVVLAGPLPVE